MEKKILVSIVIPNYNGEKFLKTCLDSLQNQTFDDFEIIVVDDASADQSLSLLRSYDSVRLFQNEKNSGFAASVNKGIKASRGKYVLLLNNDVEVTADFVENLYARIDSDDRIFSVSSKMIRYYERDLLDDTGDFYHILGWAFKRGDGKPVSRYTQSTSIFSTCAGAGIYRREVFDTIGFFDENYFAYLEDVDVSYRGLIHGYKNVYEPKAVCYHIGSATTADGKKYSPFKVKQSARNNIFMAYKNMPMLQLILNIVFLGIGFLIKGIVFSFRGYGKEYRAGIKEGLSSLKTIRKTPFRLKNLWHYVKIEIQLIVNFFRHFLVKLF